MMIARRLGLAACALGASLALPTFAGATSQTFSITPSATPNGIVLDSAGNIYTANSNSNDVARITPGGVVTMPFASSGGNYPASIVTDSTDNIFVSNAFSDLVAKITLAGATSTFALTGDYPQGMTIDDADYLYVANGGGGHDGDTVTKITPGGTPTTPFATTGVSPYSIAVAPSGNIYTADYSGDTVTKITPGGTSTTPFAATGADPIAIALGPDETIYTANDASGTVTRIASDSTTTTPFGSVGSYPSGIAVDSCGNVYTANYGSNSVTKVLPSGTSTTLGATGTGPVGIVIDGSGDLYVSNYFGSSVTKFTGGGGTPAICPAPPVTPGVAPSAVLDGSSSATVTVTPNAGNAKYGTPGSYLIEAVGDASKSCTVTPPATSCQVTGLAADTVYTFTARAALNESKSGVSAPSNAITTPGSGPSPGPQPDPGPTPTPSNAFAIGSSGAAGSAVVTTIRVPGPGSINQRGVARKAGGTACSASRNVSRAGTYTLTCRLNSAARAARRKAALRVRLRTAFTPTGGTPRSAVRTVVFRSLKPNYTG